MSRSRARLSTAAYLTICRVNAPLQALLASFSRLQSGFCTFLSGIRLLFASLMYLCLHLFFSIFSHFLSLLVASSLSRFICRITRRAPANNRVIGRPAQFIHYALNRLLTFGDGGDDTAEPGPLRYLFPEPKMLPKAPVSVRM